MLHERACEHSSSCQFAGCGGNAGLHPKLITYAGGMAMHEPF